MGDLRQVWKYPVKPDGFDLSVPEGGYVLDVQIDSKTGDPCMWILVAPDRPKEPRSFRMVGTGRDLFLGGGLVESVNYVGTWQQGPFVWHLFEEALSR